MNLFLRKNYDLIVVLIICIIIILLNFDFGKLVIGLDNASPYFNILDVIQRIKGQSAIIYGGILFQAPFIFPLRLAGISPEIVSNLYLSINLILGSLGVTLLARRSKGCGISSIFGFTVLITSLLTTWIFSNPNFLFISAYGSIPLLIYFLSKNQLLKKDYFFLTLTSLIFLTTTLNLIAFTLFLFQILLLSYVLSEKRKVIKRLVLWSILLVSTWFLSIQAIMILNGDNTFFLIRIFEYFKGLLNNPYMANITIDILASEKMNNLLNIAMYGTGWMELHNSQNSTIFKYYSLYKENILYMILGIIPFLLSMLVLIFNKTKKVLILISFLLFFLLITSRFGISIFENIEFVRDALRWSASKLWPLYIIPITLLSTTFVSSLGKIKSIFPKFLILTLFLLLFIYSLPILGGNLLSEDTQVEIPKEYYSIPRDSKILILPKPQMIYMRQYEWGYYGSDFISYINNSEIVDAANLYEYSLLYEDIFTNGEIPEDIEYILYDTSAEIYLKKETLEESRNLTKDLREITSNRYFKIYER